MAASSRSTRRSSRRLTAIRVSAGRTSACLSKSLSRCFKPTTRAIRESKASDDDWLPIISSMIKREPSALTDSDKSALLEEIPQIIARLESEISKVIIGQRNVVKQFILALLVGGHCIIKGVPGLAK